MDGSRLRQDLRRAAAAGAALLACTAFAAHAQPARPNKPITKQWECGNGRTVTINYHPYRIREPAWLTYLGNRHEVTRKRVDQGIAASTPDGKVQWHETGNAASLEYAGLLDAPLACALKAPPQPAPKSPAPKSPSK